MCPSVQHAGSNAANHDQSMCSGHRRWREESGLQSVNTLSFWMRHGSSARACCSSSLANVAICEAWERYVPHRDVTGDTLRGHGDGKYQGCQGCGIPLFSWLDSGLLSADNCEALL